MAKKRRVKNSNKASDKNKKVNITVLRRITQVLFLLLILYGGTIGIPSLLKEHAPIESEEDLAAVNLNTNLQKDARANLYLPIRSCVKVNKDSGVFQGCGLYLATNMLTYRTILAYAVPILVFILLVVLFGRTWCGWACPMGFFQEITDWVRGKLKINYIKLSTKVNKILRKIRWIWLTILFMIAFGVALPIFGTFRKDLFNFNCLTCPARIILGFFPSVDPSYIYFDTLPYLIGSIFLIIFIAIFALSFLIRRFWCRLCPNGALLALFNKGCLTTKQKDMHKCTKCGICYDVCPMDNEDVYLIKDRKVTNSKNCVMCFECVHKCPETDCLKVKVAGKTILRSKYKEYKHKQHKIK